MNTNPIVLIAPECIFNHHFEPVDTNIPSKCKQVLSNRSKVVLLIAPFSSADTAQDVNFFLDHSPCIPVGSGLQQFWLSSSFSSMIIVCSSDRPWDCGYPGESVLLIHNCNLVGFEPMG